MQLEFVYRRTRCSPKLTEFAKLQRYMWCKSNLENNFKDYVFADETTIRILEIPIYHSRKKGQTPKAQCSSAKIRMKVNVWGGISYEGPTSFVVRTFFLSNY